MIMADFTADNVVSLNRHADLLYIMSDRLPEFVSWLWPEGVRKLDRFHPIADNQTHVLVEGSRAGAAFDASGSSLGSIIDLMRLLEFKEPPGDLYRKFQKTLGPAHHQDKADDLGEFTIPIVDYLNRPVRRQEWVVDGWLPLGTVTSLYGGGGLGKSLLALHLCNAVGTGRAFFGLGTRQGKAMVIACEENDDRLHERQMDVLASMGIPLEHTGLVYLKARSGKQNQMAVSNGDNTIRLTQFFAQVREAAYRIRPVVLVIDNIAQVFAGNENSRPEVTAFCNALNGIAVELNCAVLLLGHPGKSSESEYSGSTAWDAAVRSRWYLGRPKDDGLEDDEIDPGLSDLRVLRKAKANYSSSGDEIKLAYDRDAHAFRLDAPEIPDTVGRIEANVREREAAERFMAGLRRALDQGLEPSMKKEARSNYAPKLLREHTPECRGMAVRTLELCFKRLWDAGEVVRGFGEGPRSRRAKIVVPKGHALAAPADHNRDEASHSPSHYP